MGRQIIKQPNGKYCIYSSIVDSITYYDMTREDIITEWVKEEKEKIEERVNEVVEALEEGGKPYFQFTKTYEEMIKSIREIHGDKEANKIRKLIEP